MEQAPQIGTDQERQHVGRLVDAYWRDCERCIEAAVAAVVADRGAFLALWRACILQETAVLRSPHGTSQAAAELANLGRFDTVTLRSLAQAGGQIWVNRARLFAAVDEIGKCDGQPRLLQRARGNRPGQRGRQ